MKAAALPRSRSRNRARNRFLLIIFQFDYEHDYENENENERLASLSFLIIACFAALASAQTIPWHAPGWPLRAIVKVEQLGSPDIDTAAARIIHAGTTAPTANDYRIFTSTGRPIPYQITYHDPARDTLISFRSADNPNNTFVIYYGKPDAPISPFRAIVSDTPGKGPPRPGPAAGGWIPHAGLVLVTMRRPHDPPNPETVPEMINLINGSTELDGAGYRTNISDGLNPFGDSDYYISVYRGWLRLPAPGIYGFCTCSNEASFSFLDGQDLVDWPGRHTEERGRFGQKNTERSVTEGLHYVEYLQEEVLLYQMSFLGYHPPNVKNFTGIPDYLFPQPHRALVQRYESADGKRLIVPRPELIDSRWPPGRSDGQQTRYKLAADAGAEPIDWGQWTIQWSLGDGLTADGPDPEHIYLKLGHYPVTMTATGPVGQKIESNWPLTVFEVDHVVAGFKAGQLAPYATLAAKYDAAKLTTPSLVELARLMNEAGDPVATRRASLLAIGRPDITANDLADMHLLTATSLALGAAPNDTVVSTATAAKEIIEHLLAAVAKESDPVQRVQILARCIRAVGMDQSDTDAAQKLYAQAEHEARVSSMSRQMRAALREATVAIGDVHLFNHKIDAAELDYHTAEALDDSPMPVQVKLSKVGAFPEAIEQHLEHKRIGDAMEVAKRWQHEVPSDQVHGAVLFYIGKLEYLQTRPAAAIRPLQMSIELAQGAEFEAEARWLLAQAYRDTGDKEASQRTLAGLVKSGLSGPFRQKAIDVLATDEHR